MVIPALGVYSRFSRNMFGLLSSSRLIYLPLAPKLLYH